MPGGRLHSKNQTRGPVSKSLRLISDERAVCASARPPARTDSLLTARRSIEPSPSAERRSGFSESLGAFCALFLALRASASYEPRARLRLRLRKALGKLGLEGIETRHTAPAALPIGSR